jgi:hypothetical protein
MVALFDEVQDGLERAVQGIMVVRENFLEEAELFLQEMEQLIQVVVVQRRDLMQVQEETQEAEQFS